MTMPDSKVMKIIARDEHITVKASNHPLMRLLRHMEKRGLVELADTYRDCYYFRKKGSNWRFFTEEDLERRSMYGY